MFRNMYIASTFLNLFLLSIIRVRSEKKKKIVFHWNSFTVFSTIFYSFPLRGKKKKKKCTQFVFHEITLQTLRMGFFQSCSLGAVILSWKQHSSDFASAVIVPGELIPTDKFKSTNAAPSVWSGLLCYQHSLSMRTQDIVFFSKYNQLFIQLSQECYTSGSQQYHRICFSARKKKNGSACSPPQKTTIHFICMHV